MEASPKQQIIQSIKDGKNILLLTHANIDGDGLGAMISLFLALKKIGKNVTAFSLDPVPNALQFLPEVDHYIEHEVNTKNDFVITVNCNKAKVDKLRYTIEENQVNIIITPEEGHFTNGDVSSRTGQTHYDTVIILDTGDLKQLGDVYSQNPNLFYESVVVNIDHHISNTYFANINWVDPRATSTCEMILSLLEALEAHHKQKLLDKNIATYLLTGITVDTGSFQNNNTTPKVFSIAAQLLALGADQQTIIKNLYKTHSLSKLKLWGRALSNIREDKETKLVWSVLSRQDFNDTRTKSEDIGALLDELIASAPNANIVFLMKQQEDDVVHVSIRTLDNTDASKLALLFGGGGHKKAAGFKIKGDTLEKIENFVVKKFRDYKLGHLELPTEIPQENIQSQSSQNVDHGKEFVEKVKKEIQEKTSNPESSPVKNKRRRGKNNNTKDFNLPNSSNQDTKNNSLNKPENIPTSEAPEISAAKPFADPEISSYTKDNKVNINIDNKKTSSFEESQDSSFDSLVNNFGEKNEIDSPKQTFQQPSSPISPQPITTESSLSEQDKITPEEPSSESLNKPYYSPPTKNIDTENNSNSTETHTPEFGQLTNNNINTLNNTPEASTTNSVDHTYSAPIDNTNSPQKLGVEVDTPTNSTTDPINSQNLTGNNNPLVQANPIVIPPVINGSHNSAETTNTTPDYMQTAEPQAFYNHNLNNPSSYMVNPNEQDPPVENKDQIENKDENDSIDPFSRPNINRP